MSYKKACGVYCVVNTSNGKYYFGSSIAVKRRIWSHFNELKRHAHGNAYMQSDYDECSANFVAYVLLYCDEENMLRYEQAMLDNFESAYNVSKVAGSNIGIKYPENVRCHMGKGNLGKHLSIETIENMKISRKGMKPFLGHHHTPETIELERTSHIGVKNSMYGKHHTPETLAKIKNALIGNKHATSK